MGHGQYELQLHERDVPMLRMLPTNGNGAASTSGTIELIEAKARSGHTFAVLRTDSLARLSEWRGVLDEHERPYRVVNRSAGHALDANAPDW
jgi:uncharacterized protein YjhX (UPF0386 family)